VKVPFAPPVGKTLRYRFTRTQTGGVRGRDAAFDMGVRFESLAGGGYRMQVSMTALGLPPAARRTEAVRVMEAPITFRVTADGVISGLENEAAYWASLERISRQIIAADPKAGPDDQRLMSTVQQQMRDAPPEQRLALLAKNVQPLLEFSSTEFEIGKRMESQAEVILPFAALADRKIPRLTQVVAESADTATVTFAGMMRLDPAALARAMEALAALGPKGPQSIPELQIDQRMSYVVSRQTGLTLRYTETIESGSGADHLKRVTTLQFLGD